MSNSKKKQDKMDFSRLDFKKSKRGQTRRSWGISRTTVVGKGELALASNGKTQTNTRARQRRGLFPDKATND